MRVQRFGPYELVRRLGSGGMAETYLAVRRGPGGFEQQVCVKRILPFYERDPQFVKDFLEEARLAAQLRHSNIAQVVDFGEVDGSHYLALELVDGMDLRTLLRRLRDRGERLTPSQVALVGLDLAAALDFAHTPGPNRDGVVHRDVSPSNVLVSRAGEIYLTDFGIARAVGAKRRTDSGVVKGKVPYMAPEYALHATFDGRTDLFSLGVCLYEALGGQRPFDGATELDTLQRIERGQHPPLASLAPDAPAPLVAAIERLIRPEPDQRFAGAAALIEALAPLSPPVTVRRELGVEVRGLSESLSESLRLSAPSRTAALLDAPAPAYPEVRSAAPDVATRTSDAPRQPGPPEAGWASTDPDQISHHDRPSPYGATELAQATVSATEVLPTSEPPPPMATTPLGSSAIPGIEIAAIGDSLPPAPPAAKPRRGLVVALAVLGVLTFLLATAGTYALVLALQN